MRDFAIVLAKRGKGVALLLAAMLCGAGVADAGREVTPQAKSVSEMTREELVKENLALKRENQRLRRELVRRRSDEPKVDLSKVRERKGVAGEETNGKAVDDGGFWLSEEKMRRHNSKCRYYRMGKGRPCDKDEGTPCKHCGG